MTDYTFILSQNYKGCQWSLAGDSYEGLVWFENNTIPKPSKKELDDAYSEYKNKFGYISLREDEYNRRDITDKKRLDALWDKIMENKPESADTLQNLREQVKSEIAKPE